MGCHRRLDDQLAGRSERSLLVGFPLSFAHRSPEFALPEQRRLQVYQTDQVRVSFDPNVCIHSGVCLRTLPEVFDVRLKQWIQPDKASAAAVMAAVARCPSGALKSQMVTSVLPSVKRDAKP
jgi:uncharacterized Fe-S cluster protein YjdI